MMKEQLAELWNLSRAGDMNAYQSLHQLLYPQLSAYIQQIFFDGEQTNDVLQDVFIKLWQKRQSIGPVDYVKAYFYRTARCVALNKLRDEKSDAERNTFFQQAIPAREQGSEPLRALSNALDQLPCRRREIIFLRFYAQMDYEQIAEVTGIQYQSVTESCSPGYSELKIVNGTGRAD